MNPYTLVKGALAHCCWERKLIQPLWKNSMEVPQKLKIKLKITI
jgi:hypothetical protein